MDNQQMNLTLPHGITNSFKHGKIVYHCPLCSVTIDDAGYPDRSEAAKQHMIAHVMMEHGGYPEHQRAERAASIRVAANPNPESNHE